MRQKLREDDESVTDDDASAIFICRLQGEYDVEGKWERQKARQRLREDKAYAKASLFDTA